METLLSCPDCGTTNLTPRGLTAHRGSRNCKAKADASTQSTPSTESTSLAVGQLSKLPSGTEIALGEMTIDQLRDSYAQLDRYENSCTKLSGICATLKGLVLLQAKEKCGHGNFQNWLKENFQKSYRTAAQYMRLSKHFTKSAASCTFALESNITGSLALLQDAQTAPEVRHEVAANPLVSQVAAWTEGKSAYQLLQELGEGLRGGGDGDNGARHVHTHEQLTLRLHDACISAAQALKGLYQQRAWYVLTDAELDGFINHTEEVAAEAKKWRGMSKEERQKLADQEIGKLLGN